MLFPYKQMIRTAQDLKAVISFQYGLVYLHSHCLAPSTAVLVAVGICFSICLTGASIKKCNFISFGLLIKLLTCASPSRRINSCLYKYRWKVQGARCIAGGDSVSKGSGSSLAAGQISFYQTNTLYINNIKLKELCECP